MTLVRYISPFGSPAWMTRTQAEFHLRQDDARWCHYLRIEQATKCPALSEQQRLIGPPRIEL
jgi:hypothetical protein